MAGSSLVVRIGADIQDFQKQVANLKGTTRSLGDSMIKTGKWMSTRVTAPLIALGTASLASAMSFEKSMSKVATTVTGAGYNMEKLTSIARSWGRESIFNANQVAEAMAQKGLAGLDTIDIYNSMGDTIALATSANMNLAEATTSLTNVMGVFGKTGAEAGLIADTMTSANKTVAASISDIEKTFMNAGSAIATHNVSLRDATIMTALMADNSLVGAKAGTAMRAMFDDLALACANSNEAMRALNVEFFDAEGNARPAIDVIRNLRETLGDLSPAQQIAKMEMMDISVTGQKALIPMLQASDERLEYLAKRFEDVGGAAQHYADIMSDNLKAELKIFWNNIRDIGIELGNVFLPAIREVVGGVTTLASSFAENLTPGMARAIVKVGAFVGAVGPLLIIGGKTINMIRDTKNAYRALGNFITSKWIPTQNKAKIAQIQKNSATKTSTTLTAAQIGTLNKHKIATVGNTQAGNLNIKMKKTKRAELVKNSAAYTAGTKAMTVQKATLKAKTSVLLANTKAMTTMNAKMMLITAKTKTTTAVMTGFKKTLLVLKTAKLALATGGIALVITGIGSLISRISAAREASEEWQESTEKATNRSKELRNTVDESRAAFERQRAQIEMGNAVMVNAIDRAQELAQKESLSAEQRRELEGITNELNEVLGTSIELFDTEGNVIAENVEHFRARNDLRLDQEKLNVFQERANELALEEQQLLRENSELQEKKNELRDKLEGGIRNQSAYNELLSELEEQYGANEVALYGVREELYSTTEAIAEKERAIDEVKASIELYSLTLDDLSEQQQEVVERMIGYWQQYRDAGREMFSQMENATKMHTYVVDEEGNLVRKSLQETGATHEQVMEQMIDNMRANRERMQEWSQNLTHIANEFCIEFAQYLRDLGPEAAFYVDAMANGCEKILSELVEEWHRAGDYATDNLANAIGEGSDEVVALVEHLGSDVYTTLRDQIESADFAQIGIGVGQGLAEGVEQSTPQAESACQTLADGMIRTTRDALGANSPAREFIPIGKSIITGLVQGITSSKGQLTSALNGLVPLFRNTGQQSMQSLNQGMQSTKGQVTNTVNNMMQQINRSIDQGSNQMGRAFENLSRNTTQIITRMSSEANRLLMDMNRRMSQSVERGASDVKRGFQSMKRDGIHEVQNMKRDITRTMNEWPNIASRSMTNMNNSMRTAMSNANSTVRSGNTTLVSTMNTLQGSFQSAGSNAMAGLNRGLANGRSGVVNTARNIANDISRTIRNSLQMNSPSRVLMGIGKEVPNSLSLGIETNADKVEREMKLLSDKIKTSFNIKSMIKLETDFNALRVPSDRDFKPLQIQRKQLQRAGNSFNEGTFSNTSRIEFLLQQILERGQSLIIDGAEFAQVTHEHYDALGGSKTILTERLG